MEHVPKSTAARTFDPFNSAPVPSVAPAPGVPRLPTLPPPPTPVTETAGKFGGTTIKLARSVSIFD